MGLNAYQCNALVVAFMKLNPFPWRQTHECLKSLLRYPFDMKEFHHAMHMHGGTLFNYWRHYIRDHTHFKYKTIVKDCLFANHQERYRAVWMLREDRAWKRLESVGEWYDDHDACLQVVDTHNPPTVDYPESLQPKDMEIVLTVESQCARCCDDTCSCQPPIRCPIKHIYDVPYGFEGNVNMMSTARGLTYAYTYHCLQNSDVEHYVINGVHVLREKPDENASSECGKKYSYYIATYDEWFESEERCAILAFEKFMDFAKCQCWNDNCPCGVQ